MGAFCRTDSAIHYLRSRAIQSGNERMRALRRLARNALYSSGLIMIDMREWLHVLVMMRSMSASSFFGCSCILGWSLWCRMGYGYGLVRVDCWIVPTKKRLDARVVCFKSRFCFLAIACIRKRDCYKMSKTHL